MTDTARVSRAEMGITHRDFLRIFPRLVSDAEASVTTAGARVEWPEGRWLEVEMSAEQIRRIALLKMPYVNLEFTFGGFEPLEQARFMERFDRAFHKGGG